MAMGLSPDGKQILHVYDVYKQKVINTIPISDVVLSPVQPMFFSSDGRSVALTGSPSVVVNLETNTVSLIKVASDHVVFSSNHKKLVLLPYSNKLVVYDLETGKKTTTTLPIKSHCRAANSVTSLNKRY